MPAAEVQVSSMPVPSSSPLRRLNSYSTSSFSYRSSSLDRGRDSSYATTSSSTYRTSYLTSSSSFTSSIPSSSRPPRPSAIASSSSSLLLGEGCSGKKLGDLTRRLPPTARAKFDVSTTVVGSSSSRSSPARSPGHVRRHIDAISDSSSSPVLTKYRDLSDADAGGYRPLYHHRPLDLSSSASEVNNGKPRSRAPSPGTSSTGSTSSSSSSTLLDENCNRLRTSRYVDGNRNVYSPPRSTRDSDLGSSRPSSISPSSSRHWRSLGSSSSSVDSGCSSSDYSPSPQRSRKSSVISEESSNGVNFTAGSKTKESDKGGLVGLRNLGNTCFLNCVMQCLSHTKLLLDYCLRDAYLSDINSARSSMKGALIREFASLLQAMWKAGGNETALSPQAFKSEIQRFAPRFMGYSQQDAQEFLHYLLQGLHEDVNRVVTRPRSFSSEIDDNMPENQKAMESWKRYLRFDDSKIVDLFVGQLKSTLHCTACNHNSVTFDPFWDLSLPIPKGSSQVTLHQCLSLFTKEEVLDGEEKPTCCKCKSRQKCTKSFTIHKFPKILVLHLKRLSPSERFRAKLNTSVDFPLTSLDLSPYGSSSTRGYQAIYNLYGVSNHSGSTYSGHYTAICRHPHLGEWHEFNDSKVSRVNAGNVVSPEAYVLFYELTSQSSRL